MNKLYSHLHKCFTLQGNIKNYNISNSEISIIQTYMNILKSYGQIRQTLLDKNKNTINPEAPDC